MTRTPFRRHALCAALIGLGLATTVAAQQSASPGSGTAGGAATTQGAAGMQGGAGARKAADGLERAERRFVEKAALGGMAEVQLGQLAQQKAQSEQVQQFARRMVADHGKANEELKQVAGAKSVQLPTELDRSHRRDIDKLQKLSGADFDRAYMKHMVDDHKEDVSDFRKQAKSGKDPELKAFAEKTLPTLEEHLKMAQSTYDGVKTRKSASAK